MSGRSGESPLQREVRVVAELGDWVRFELIRVRAGRWRADATTAIAASAAEETYRVADHLPEWQNETSRAWQAHLQNVWKFLAGDRSQHYALSRAVAEYLVSPLNHNEGQDGPDDFDRPQTVAAYSATLAAIMWGIDFAVTAVTQIFEAVDLKYEGDVEPHERWVEVQREIDFVRRVVSAVVRYDLPAGQGFSPELLNSIRS